MTAGRAARQSDVSVLLATFNRAGYLGAALDSLLSQSIEALEVIVVDDGSTDGTARVLAGFGDRVRVLRKINGGKSSALNAGMPLVRGSFVWIFDDDDIAMPDALERLLAPLGAEEALGFAYGRNGEFRIGADGIRRDVHPHQAPTPPDDLYPALLEACLIHQGAMLVRRSCYDTVGRFDERLVRSQDYDMLLRIARRFPARDIGGHPVYMRRMHEGVRGRLGEAVAAGRLREGWRRYDEMLFRRIRESHGLDEYLPRRQSAADELTAEETALALARRSSVLARKGLWELAAEDLLRFAETVAGQCRSRLLPREHAAFATVLDGRSHCRDDLPAGRAEAFTMQLAGLRDRRLAEEIRAALLDGIGLRQTVKLYGRLSTSADVLRAGVGRLRAGVSAG